MSRDTKEYRKPGEKAEGKFHYNPGNMSGKSAEICKDTPEQENNIDRIKSRKAPRKETS